MTQNRPGSEDPLTLRGRMLSMTVMRLGSPNVERITDSLDRKLEQGGALLRSLPVVLEQVPDGINLGGLITALRDRGLTPVGLLDAAEPLKSDARTLGLGLIDDPRSGRDASGDSAGDKAPVGQAGNKSPLQRREPSMLVSKPVRSGQQIYARNADLILLAPVSAGAEVIADGCIHAYAALRGRAIAGAAGDVSARIFTQRLEAELLSVAGCYQVSEDFSLQWRGQSVQIHLDDGQLKMEQLVAA